MISDLETAILNLVKDAGNDILDIDILVNKLDESKVQSKKISEELEKAEILQNQLIKKVHFIVLFQYVAQFYILLLLH